MPAQPMPAANAGALVIKHEDHGPHLKAVLFRKASTGAWVQLGEVRVSYAMAQAALSRLEGTPGPDELGFVESPDELGRLGGKIKKVAKKIAKSKLIRGVVAIGKVATAIIPGGAALSAGVRGGKAIAKMSKGIKAGRAMRSAYRAPVEEETYDTEGEEVEEVGAIKKKPAPKAKAKPAPKAKAKPAPKAKAKPAPKAKAKPAPKAKAKPAPKPKAVKAKPAPKPKAVKAKPAPKPKAVKAKPAPKPKAVKAAGKTPPKLLLARPKAAAKPPSVDLQAAAADANEPFDPMDNQQGFRALMAATQATEPDDGEDFDGGGGGFGGGGASGEWEEDEAAEEPIPVDPVIAEKVAILTSEIEDDAPELAEAIAQLPETTRASRDLPQARAAEAARVLANTEPERRPEVAQVMERRLNQYKVIAPDGSITWVPADVAEAS